MIDHSGTFDARRVGWWQRRSVVRRIRSAAGITDADRDLRVRSARAAQTRGELNALTSDLAGTPQPRAAVQAPPPPPAYRPPAQYAPPPRPTAPKRAVGRPLLIGLVVIVFLIGGSVVSCVSTIVETATDFSTGSESSTPTEPKELQTVGGWSQLVRSFDEEVGGGRVIKVVVRRTAAIFSVPDPDDPDLEQQFYYDGDITQAESTTRTPSALPFELSSIEPVVVADAVAQARSRSRAVSGSESWVTIIDSGDGPRITVNFLDGSVGAYERVVDSNGDEISETPSGL